MKPEEKLFFETFISVHPNFLRMKIWAPGPEPPDVLIADVYDRQLGLELTEWLDKRQTTPSIADQENEMRWLDALNRRDGNEPQRFQLAQIWFRRGTRFSQQEEVNFEKEFYDLASHVDHDWELDMANTPQKIWNDFTEYPTVGRHVHLIQFVDRLPLRPQRWIVGTPKGGAYDPRRMTQALLQRIEEKRNKPNYANLKAQHGFAELVLLVHYGIRGLIHNDPFEGINWKIVDVVAEARASLLAGARPFNRVFLYLAYNEGQLFALYP